MESTNQTFETTKRKLEIIHFDQVDVVLPGSVESDQSKPYIQTLLELTGNFDQGPVCDYKKGRWRDNVFNVDFGDNAPKYFIKQRFMAGPENYRETKRLFSIKSDDFRYSPRTLSVMQSILNEFYLAPTVQEILNGHSVREILNRFDYDSATLVEPIVGVIQKDTGSKFMIYEYHDFMMPNSTRKRDPDLCIWLRQAIYKNGILAEDLCPRNLHDVADEPSTLYLIDIEAYSKVKN